MGGFAAIVGLHGQAAASTPAWRTVCKRGGGTLVARRHNSELAPETSSASCILDDERRSLASRRAGVYHPVSDPMPLHFGEFSLDPERRQLLRAGEAVALEPKAYELLTLLATRRPRVLSKAQIRDVLWPGTVVAETSLPRLVNQLRQALADDARESRFIRTAHGFGYAFCGEVDDGEGGRTGSREAEAGNPYPGLASFGEGDAALFFGREDEAAAVWDRLRSRRLLAVIGPSGAGKSSFVRAGVVASRPDGWAAIVATPSTSPLRALGQALGPELASDPEALRKLAAFEDGDNAFELLSRWRQARGRALLVIDAFEQLFTLNPPETRARLAALLDRLVAEADLGVLLSLRDDFLMRCHEHEALRPVFGELTPLGPPTREGLRRAITEPARWRGYGYEDDGLVDEMVESVAGGRGALPLLAFAVSRLWEKRDREGKRLTRRAYEEIGGVAGALARHAEATLERVGSSDEGIVREMFRSLTTAQGTRGVLEAEELLSAFPDRGRAEGVLAQLVDARLLTSYEADGGEEGLGRARVEVVHESLLTAWPRLVRWRTQDAGGAQLRDQLRMAARLWDERGRPLDLLWTGASFLEYRAWRERYPGGLSALEEDFASSMVALAGRRRRRRRLVLGAALVAALALAAFTSWSWRSADAARRRVEAEAARAEAGKLVVLGQQAESFPSAALAFATASVEVADTEAGRMLALRVLQSAPTGFFLPTPELTREGLSLALSPDGERLALGGFTRVQLRSLSGAAPVLLGDYPPTLGEVSVAFAPDGTTLAAARGADIRLFSVPDGRERGRSLPESPLAPAGHSSMLTATDVWGLDEGFLVVSRVGPRDLVRFWPHGASDPRTLGTTDPLPARDAARRLFAFASGRSVYVRPASDWTFAPRLVGRHEAEVRGLALSPDASRLAAGDAGGEVRVWPARAGGEATATVLHVPEDPRDLVLRFDASGRRLAVGTREGDGSRIRLFDLDAPADAEPLTIRREGSVSTLAATFDPKGRWLLTGHPNDAAFWPLDGEYPCVLAGHRDAVLWVGFAPDGRSLVSASADGTVREWPWPGTQPSRVLLRTGEIREMAADAVSGRIAVSRFDGRVLVLSPGGGVPREIDPGAGIYGALAFGDGGRLLAVDTLDSGKGVPVRVYDLETGAARDLPPIPGTGPGDPLGITSLRFLDGERLLASAATYFKGPPSPGLVLFDLRAGEARILRPQPDFLFALDRGGTLGVGTTFASADASLAGFELPGGAPFPVASHGAGLTAVALNSAGRLVATGSVDGTVRVGALAGGEPHVLLGHRSPVNAVAFSPDGRLLASGGADRTIRLWRVPDLSRPPLHRRPRAALVALLRTHTNVRAVADPGEAAGWGLALDPFPGWSRLPDR